MEIKFGDCWSPAHAMTREIMSMFFPNYEKCGEYEYGTIGGLYKMDVSGSIEIVAIHNECPHNGDFQRFMDELESLARRQKKPVRMVCFMNDRLLKTGWLAGLCVCKGRIRICTARKIRNTCVC